MQGNGRGFRYSLLLKPDGFSSGSKIYFGVLIPEYLQDFEDPLFPYRWSRVPAARIDLWVIFFNTRDVCI